MRKDDRSRADSRVQAGASVPPNATSIVEPTGGFTTVDGEPFYRIGGYDRMPSFLMTLASDTDLWMFVTSRGGLTAGRVDPDGALFPYETVDKLHQSHYHTGPVTQIRVKREGRTAELWQPFAEPNPTRDGIERNLYKNGVGNRLLFEEVHHELGLMFRYRWAGCDAFGWVRTARLMNLDSSPVDIELLDGLLNILPYGAPLALYQQSSSLVNAYKRIECDPGTRLGIVSLTSRIVDRPEPAEVLRANTVWCSGLGPIRVALSAEAVGAFGRGEPIVDERALLGRRANYLVTSVLKLEPSADISWHMAADVGRDAAQVAGLRQQLSDGLDRAVDDGLRDADRNLVRIVGSADGLQFTGHPETETHHLANVLFNCMRGGVFDGNYTVPTADFADYLETRNRGVAERHSGFADSSGGTIPLSELLNAAEATGDLDLQRLCREYLPIWFGRRHGDPSRPWNRFAIRFRNSDGERVLQYEGNWRDIFQNWEALSLSFPGFLPGIIAKFVNASTIDGYNPYRITRDGVDWEVIDEHDPWSYIGYWGDHQIIYLLKFLEALPRYTPRALEELLDREIFCYADVPYRIAPYDMILRDPDTTIAYDHELAARIEERVGEIGTDGKLVHGADGSIHHVNLLEKLLVPALSKLSNFVPDGGIWMNTQRPEWNDANNALVGNGISVVTLCYLRRYLKYLMELLVSWDGEAACVSREVAVWFHDIRTILERGREPAAGAHSSDIDRRRVMDALGTTFSVYRNAVYKRGFSGKEELPVNDIVAFCASALELIDPAIRSNRREDGLYHAYNLLEIDEAQSRAAIRPLYEMLEGQVAALSSGVIDPAEAATMLDSLFKSPLYRKDQRSFLLYPDRMLPGFLERNTVPEERVQSVQLLRDLVDAGDSSILTRDVTGVCRFHGDFRNASDLSAALDRLEAHDAWRSAVARDRGSVLGVFEAVFDHRSFTGRSGTMVGYEGLGCVYWHMVAKLLLAVQEIALRAAKERDPAFDKLARGYNLIRGGLGFEKTVAEYGAFPTDPYSHTPPHGGARQPGMTGQVKEEILIRFGELGVTVDEGRLSFRPTLLRTQEFRRKPGVFKYVDLNGEVRAIDIPPGALAFTVCQVPVVYVASDEARMRIVARDGTETRCEGDLLDSATSRQVFDRTGSIEQIEIEIPKARLLRG